jgi:hypothetical protein
MRYYKGVFQPVNDPINQYTPADNKALVSIVICHTLTQLAD